MEAKKILELLELINDIENLLVKLKEENPACLKSEDIEKFDLFRRNKDFLEITLKKAAIISFIAEFEHLILSTVLHKKIKREFKRKFRKEYIKELKYENIKNLFENSYWKSLEREIHQRIGLSENPETLYPFDDIVNIRHELAHSWKSERLIEIGTLKRVIEYMEKLVEELQRS